MKNKLILGVLTVFVLGMLSASSVSAIPAPFAQNVTYSNPVGSGLGVVPGCVETVTFDLVYSDFNTEDFTGELYLYSTMGILHEQLEQPLFIEEDGMYKAYLGPIIMSSGDVLNKEIVVEAKEDAISGLWGTLDIIPISEEGMYIKTSIRVGILYPDGDEYPDIDDLPPDQPQPFDPFAWFRDLASTIISYAQWFIVGMIIGIFTIPVIIAKVRRTKT